MDTTMLRILSLTTLFACGFLEAEPAAAADCDFYLPMLDKLKRSCDAGESCPDYRAMKARARDEGCIGGTPPRAARTPRPKTAAPQAPAPTPTLVVPELGPDDFSQPPEKQQACSEIPTDPAFFRNQAEEVLKRKVEAYTEVLADLRELQRKQKDEFDSDVGELGSNTANINDLRMTAKTTLDLVGGILPLTPVKNASGKAALTAIDFFKAYKTGKTVKGLIAADSDQVLFDFTMDAAGEMNVYMKAVNVIRGFAENVMIMRSADEARQQYRQSMAKIEGVIMEVQRKLIDSQEKLAALTANKVKTRWDSLRNLCVREARLP
ncbi:hypothetical protein [Mesorhizobium helmanticense]|uniref:Uncharacterized protein n=1 Tax=Mesorhizobium helmanticense TaxID=1776423 RepID=A0A2T4J3B1_9HYPH|nr:hypothetical protein [Mesorhizobium helmanticense]PTE12380.1 hypothetical protein C9427_02010 [Mesorhizobium helmanticense]